VVVLGLVMLWGCRPPQMDELSDAGDDGGVDAGPIDAGISCDNPLATPEMSCGFLGWAQSPISTRPRNHHLVEIVQTDAGVFLYAVGGFTSGATYSYVDRAPVYADGGLGAFVSDTALPMGMGGMTGGLLGNLLVVAGGQGPSGANLSSSHFAVVQADGSLGAWQSGSDTGQKRMHAGSFVRGDTMYVMGGFNDPDVWDDVIKANVTSNNTLSGWTPAGKLPGKRSHMGVSAAGDYVYMTGGLDQSAFGNPPDLTEVWRGRVTESGELGEWAAMSPLPMPLSTHGSFIYGGYLYVAGGITGSSQVKRVWRVPIAADHSLGAWEDVAALPVPRSHVHKLPVLDGHVYSVAGAIDGFLDSTGDIQIGTFLFQ
jgi:hypothetical protein